MAQQIIIFVGPDRCGKTEISQALSHILNIPRFKASSEHGSFLNKQDLFVNQLRYADTRMVDFLLQTHHSVIYDRAFPCEKVYSEFYGRQTDLSVLEHVDNEMAYMGAKIIVCHRSSYENVIDDLDPKLKGENLQKIENGYRDFAKWSKCETLFLNVDDQNLVREIGDILDFLGIKSPTYDSCMDEAREYDAMLRSGAAVCCV